MNAPDSALAGRYPRYVSLAAFLLAVACRSGSGYDDSACQRVVTDVWNHNVPEETYNLVEDLHALIGEPLTGNPERFSLEELLALCRRARPNPTRLRCVVNAHDEDDIARCKKMHYDRPR